MKNIKKALKLKILGFTLIELVAVIVVLSIIIGILVPRILGVIRNATMGAMESDAKLVLNAIEQRKALNQDIDPIQYNNNMQQLLNDLGLSGENYEDVSFLYNNDVLLITVEGKEKYNGFTACGSFHNMRVIEGGCDFDLIAPIITLNGDSKIILEVGDTYVELGATAVDDRDGNVEVIITGTVDTSVEGVYIITYSATDSMGNKSSITREVDVVLDNVNPEILTAVLISNNSNNKLAKNGDTLTLNITFSEEVRNPTIKIWGIDVNINGNGTTWTATYQIPTDESDMLEGNIGINISNYIDLAGNEGNVLTGITDVIYDRTGPVCTNSGGSSTWSNTNLTIIGTCSDYISGCVGNVTKIYSSDINSTTESSGTINDNAGNSTICPSNQTVKIDKTPPTCTNSGGNSTWRNTNLTLTGTCSDNLSGCVGNITKIYSSDINSTIESPGTIYDNAGNSAICPSNQTVRIDKTSPTCIASKSNIGTTNGVTVTVTGTDELSKIASGNVTYTGVKTTTSYNVTDAAGNSGSCSTTVTSQTQYSSSTCSTYVNCQHTNCGWNSCLTGSNTCVGGYNSCVNSACGCTYYNTCAHSECGCAAYNTCATGGCGCACKTYGSWHTSGSVFYRQTNASYGKSEAEGDCNYWYRNCSSEGPGVCSYHSLASPCYACQTYDRDETGCAVYNTCTHSECGCAAYNTCATGGCGCAAYNTCQTSGCGWNNCLTGSNTCVGGYNYCRTDPCGCETWGSWGSWTTTICTASGNTTKCQTRVVYN